MKEATGELNMTVITVVAVVAIGAFFTIFILPGLQDSIAAQTICSNGPNTTLEANADRGAVTCGDINPGDETFKCTYADLDGTTHNVICDTYDCIW